MANEIIINSHPLERRVAIIEDNKLVELLVEKKEQKNIVGNIYKGIVKDVIPGLGAAFIEIGLERTAFLHYSDIVTDFFEEFESTNKKLKHIEKDSSKIKDYIKKNQEVIVQVLKGPIGTKGARITGQISLPGKYLVFSPNKKNIAISKKIKNTEDRNRIKKILENHKPKEIGLIVRTATLNASEEDLLIELKNMINSWRIIDKQIKYAKAPVCIFDENDLSNILIRDLFNYQFNRMVIDDKLIVANLKNRLKYVSSELANRVEYYQEDSPIFDAYGIEKEIEKLFKSRINLPSGGDIVIEQTEALVAVDVNSGSFLGKNYEETIKQTNIEAAIEVARQIRLRDLSGIVVIDFIDMKEEKSKNLVLEELKKALKKDRAKPKSFPFGPLGLVEISRKRTRMNMITAHSERCPHCNGVGRVLSRDAVAMRIYRWLHRAEYYLNNKSLKIVLHPNVKEFLFINPKYLRTVSKLTELVEDSNLKLDEFYIYDMETDKDITTKYSS